MKNLLPLCAVALLPYMASAQTSDQITQTIVDTHVLPGFANLAAQSTALATTAAHNCSATSVDLRMAYGAAFDAWIAVSHLRFGPTETDERAFALAFWPDSRAATPKALATLIRTADPIAADAETYSDMSIAARGFYALEFLLYDPTISTAGADDYRCQLVQTITADIENLASAINADWQHDYADRLKSPTETGTYRTQDESVQELFKALNTGLQLASDTRLGRPLGTFERPRPTRAEARRSGRSVQHVDVALTSLRDLAHHLAAGDPALQTRFDDGFALALSQLQALPDPVFAAVAEPQSRFKVEIVQTSIEALRTISHDSLGPKLGVAAGFNALDGD
jgi:predicted lipoprotein